MKQINSLIVLGGGTAGWISAFYAKMFAKIPRVLVIESDKVPIIGAGEGSTGIISSLVSMIGEERFLKETQGSIKLGIKHKGWKKDNTDYLGPIDSPERFSADHTEVYPWMVNNKLSISSTHYNAKIMEKDGYSPVIVAEDRLFSPFGTAFHFDGHLVSLTLKTFLKMMGVEFLKDNINDVGVTEEGIDCLVGEKNSYYADYFIDASGFNSVIFQKKLGIKWIDYSKNLSLNAALPFTLESSLETLETYTTAQAMKYGWMWKIPKQNNIGYGYVFNKDFINFDEAQKEIEDFLNVKIDPIKQISFNPGRLEKFAYKNSLCVGLSSAFLEPLEATSIHGTIMQLELWKFLLEDVYSEEKYNSKIANMYDSYRDFIILHYKGGKTETDFWRYQSSNTTNTEKVDNILEMCNNGELLNFQDEFLGLPLLMPVLYGLGLVNKLNKIGSNPPKEFFMLWEKLEPMLLKNIDLYPRI